MGRLWDQYEKDAGWKEFYLKHRVEESVDCITFSDLVKRNKIKQIDLLQIDVEGSELDILKTIDFAGCPIRFVNYESVLLHERKSETEALMRGHGYHLVDYDQDTFCYQSRDAVIARRWRRWNLNRITGGG